MSFPHPLVIFDLDGTLVDSAPDIAEAVNRTLTDWKLRNFDLDQITNWIGEGSRQLITYAMRAAGSEADIDEVMPGFLKHYGDTALDGQLYPGVAETLAALHAQGAKLAVCTNKPGQFVRPLLEARGVLQYFDGIVAGDTLPQRKPAPEPLWHLVEQFGAALKTCLMVGDSESDAVSAHNAGMPLVMVRYGYRKQYDLDAAGAVAVIDHFADLLTLP
ncbi:phosphoglycolate phosphatase [Pseudoxanthomonas sp. JBR18]|uniref:phosphoglycolate phosphatase n=1 Tax=Pseudoxanthomonas sp. JBR18 TaxID=2969308 RepID=UPI00230604AA|nr:phosphoglycolate phosphatase [Pseudoxanthomonas sp. JBR18]WCE02745.1 phosphoglycolate phosphatase [Pseudoxanthomonas sp. JBR18]